MKVTAIVSDLDGTLLNGESALSAFAITTLREARQRGIPFIASSGRAAASMRPFVQQLDTGDPYIACNGGQLVGPDHRPIETLALSVPLTREIIAYHQARGRYVHIYRDECFYYAAECEYSRGYMRSSYLTGVEVGDLLTGCDFETPKVLCVMEPEGVPAAYAEAARDFTGRAEFTVSGPRFLEAQPLHANKGEGLERLAARMGLDLRTTVAFGDSINDIPMLKAVGYGVAMGNALPAVKDAARYVCDTNRNDGVARFLRERVLLDGEAEA